MKKIIPVILSGGSGTRLWPLSRREKPKQFLSLVSDRTMIQETLLRLEGLEIDSPIVSCNENHRFLVAQQVGEICEEKPTILLEPVAKNTAPAIAAASCAAMKRDKDAVVIVLPSDHVITDVDAFQKAVLCAVEEAEKGFLVTFGVVPTFPSTGYGYIKGANEQQTANGTVLDLEKFVEKPDLKTAESYLASGEYSWNSGMFVFKASVFLEELEKYMPEMHGLACAAYERAKVDEDFVRLERGCFELIKGDSIDYAVMERTSRGKVVKLDAGWNDVGSWTALWDVQDKDASGNVIKGNAVILDTKNCYIHAGKRAVATVGLEDLVIVDSEDSLLVAAKKNIQDVKKIAEMANKRFV